jgi:predicted aconitase with swiveling domain
MLEPDAILALGAMVADEIYGRSLPVVVVGERMFASLQTGDFVAVGPDGSVLQVDVGRDGPRTGGHRRGVET